MKLHDTIAAIATPRGAGGIAIIRLSGGGAEAVASQLAVSNSGKPVEAFESHKLTLCRITAADNPNFLIDEALVSVMRAPKSYTGENVVEINCHGGFLAADKILNELLKCGARLAEPGEFTRRAFINGKTDLSSAEAVMDLMNSHTDSGLHNAAMSLTGALAEKINAMRNELLEIAAHVSAAADYPDEVEPLGTDELNKKIKKIRKSLADMLSGFETGRILRDGVRTAIIGRPNVGKSSILNALLRHERAIVTDIPGTTRDTIEEFISIGGIALCLTDTAGIRSASNEVEKIGIERSRQSLRDADLCLLVIDASQPITEDDVKIAADLIGKKTIIILNKTDIAAKINPQTAAAELGLTAEAVVSTSAPKGKKPQGIKSLENAVSDIFVNGKINPDEVYISNERQRDSLLRADSALSRAADGICAGLPFDLLFIDLEDALSALGEVTGATVQEEIIDSVFENFCVGK